MKTAFERMKEAWQWTILQKIAREKEKLAREPKHNHFIPIFPARKQK